MSGEECTIQVNEESHWISRMDGELKELEQNRSEKLQRWKETSIYKIPPSLNALCEEAYRPQMVAIGPYHHDDEQLKDMEEHKMRAVLKFLTRSDKTFEFYVTALTPSLQKFKSAYHQLQLQLHTNVDDDKFLKMMIVDGCFMLEVMRSYTDYKKEDAYASVYEVEDPIFSNHGRLYFRPYLQRDMLMLENQIPLLVLIKLIDAERSWKQEELTDCILLFLDRKERIGKIQDLEKCPHLLYLYRKSLLSRSPNPEKDKEKEEEKKKEREKIKGGASGYCGLDWWRGKKKGEQDSMRSATELRSAWIRLKESESTCLDDIKFNGEHLKLPHIKVDDATKHLYLNLMALERLQVDVGNEVTSYVYFMDKLIDTAEDVKLLHWRGIMVNMLGSDQDVADMFNKLSTDISYDEQTVFSDVMKKVANYYRMPLPRCIAYAQHTYCTNPWVVLSLFAAIFLFGLTIVQTLYAVLDYNKK